MSLRHKVSKNLQNLLSFCLARWHLAIATASLSVNGYVFRVGIGLLL